MKLRITIYSDLLESEENIHKYGVSLQKAFVNEESCELDISEIPGELILPIIQNHIKNTSLDEIQSIEGGLRIDIGNQELEWTCCENITDFYHWEETLQTTNEDWNYLWIGHPWIYFRLKNDKIQFSNYTDDTEIVPEKLTVKLELDYSEFKRQLQIKCLEMKAFKQKIRSAINSNELENREMIIERIVGINAQQ